MKISPKNSIANSLKVIPALVFLLMCAASVFAQKVDINPLTVNKTNIIDDLKKIKTANPKIAPEEFVVVANALLEKKGMPFVFAFDAATCLKIEQAKKARKDQNAPLNLRTALKSVAGEAASLLLPEPGFDRSECAPCYVALPILELTDKDFITLVEGANIKFHLPANFKASEAALVDEKDLKIVATKWKLPFRTVPLSISDKGDIVYVGFSEAELSDLVLLVYADGNFQFDARKNLDASKKGALLKEHPKDAANPQLAYIRFTSDDGGGSQTIRFSARCQ